MLDLPALYATCAPEVHATTIAAIVRVESGGNPLAINVNRLARHLQPRPRTVDEAVAAAEHWTAQVDPTTGRRYTVDLGLAQINSSNLAALGLSLRQVLEPCTNLAAAQVILQADYRRATASMGAGQAALLATLSAYNTGSLERGFANGYVAKYGVGGRPSQESQGVAERSVPERRPARRVSPYSADTAVAWGPGGDHTE